MANYFLTDELQLNVARGLVKDATVVNIFGYNANVGLSFIPLWENDTALSYPTTNTILNIASSNTEDTNITLVVQGVDSNYDMISDTITLNGTTSVNTTKGFYRINSVVVIAGDEKGSITLSNNATTYAKISNGTGKNQSSTYTVPRGYEFYLYRIDGFSATALANKYVFFRNTAKNVAANTVLRVAETTFLNNMNIRRVFPFKYNEKTDIEFQAKSSSQTNEVGIFAEGVLVKKPIGS